MNAITAWPFDPESVSIIGIDHQLPAVEAARLQVDALRARFRAPPPWEPEQRPEIPISDRASCPAAVLVPLVMRAAPTLLLTRRSLALSTHAGQIAFPGGKIEAMDGSPHAAALRETYEEIGLHAHQIEVIGQLPMYRTGTAFDVTPVVALVHPSCTWTANPDEVADVFEVPLAYLMNPANHQRRAVQWQGQWHHWFAMPYHDGHQERHIWGATAGMLRNLYRMLSA